MRLILATILLIITTIALAQGPVFTRQDTLRGTVTAERSWWDLTHYHLDVKANPQDSTIKGTNTVHYKVLDANQKMQIDLQPHMKINKVLDEVHVWASTVHLFGKS